MSRNRYQIILRFIHFTDNTKPNQPDKLWKVRTIYDLLCTNFTNNCQPPEHLSLDEGTLAWRGRLSFKTYNPNKPDKYGIKGYIVSESVTGYVWRYQVYHGEGRKLVEIVQSLLEPARGKGHSVYMDNYYNSVKLCQILKDQGIDSVGTVRANRGAPKLLQIAGKALKAKGSTVYACITNDNKPKVLVQYWKDKRVVSTVSTKNSPQMVPSNKTDRTTGEIVVKPETVLEYNKYMSGVDKCDQMIKYFPWIRGSMKWTVKFVFYLFQIAMYNSYCLYKVDKTQPEYRSFIMDIIRDIHAKHSKRALHPSTPPRPGSSLSTTSSNQSREHHVQPIQNPKTTPRSDPALRLSGRITDHKLAILPPTPKKPHPTRICRVCIRSGKRSETRYICLQCNIPLHQGPCYTKYHSLSKYW